MLPRQESMIEGIGGGKTIGILTSGGDAQGMNAAVRAVARMALYCSANVCIIREGYQGLIDCGENIQQTKWYDVSGILELGGTVIGSARCADFRKPEGRLKACLNLIKKRITHLCVIGGDGSLTGADALRSEWPELITQLFANNEITADEKNTFEILHIVGIVGSIDNDFCGTDMTIGTDTALHRIIECVDSIMTTAHSHQRAFILEVMGRNCGYLALSTAIASSADWVFVPEEPPLEGWEDEMCRKIKASREYGNRLNIIVIAEGAVDRDGKPITSAHIKSICSDRMNLDTRVTVLGHVQRGGRPSAFDRVLATRMGSEAAIALLEAQDNTPAYVISLQGNQMVRVPMMEAVSQTKEVASALADKDWTRVAKLRGKSFERNVKMYHTLGANIPVDALPTPGVKVGLVNIGAPAGGVNAAVRAVVRTCINNNVKPAVIRNGIGGLVTPDGVHEYKWWDVRNFIQHGGTNIGTSRKLPSDYGVDKLLTALKSYRMSGLIIIGGYEACVSARELTNAGCKIPIIVIPATLSNNITGTELTIGADTALNAVIHACDTIRTSATSTKGRVFIVETMGGYCGYLSCLAGLAAGADSVYINEQPQSINDILGNISHLSKKMQGPIKRGIIIRNERASENYTTDFLHNIYSEEAKDIFDVRTLTLGHIQQGGAPSPFDRTVATKLGSIACTEIIKVIGNNWNTTENACNMGNHKYCHMIGINRKTIDFHDLHELEKITDPKKRRPSCNFQWWLNLVYMQRIMAHYSNQSYVTEGNSDTVQDLNRLISCMGLNNQSAVMKPSVTDALLVDIPKPVFESAPSEDSY